jgi:hypothetical protein
MILKIFRQLTGFLPKHGRISKGALERSSSTSLHQSVSTENCVLVTFTVTRLLILKFFQTPRHLVVTLDSNKFAEKKQQRLHIGDHVYIQTYIRRHNQSSPVISPRLIYDTKLESGKWTSLSYPPNTKAFLYYYTLPEIPRIGGELRFRVASSDDPASFESGSDLMKPNGQVWSRPLFVLSKAYIPLYEKLREELFVPDDLDAVLSTFPHTFGQYRQSQCLYTLNDTFIVNFSASKQAVAVITEQGMEKLRLRGLFSEKIHGRPYTGESPSPSLHSPRLMILNEFVGSALVRFERSTFPDHIGTRTVVLRFLKIITPVKCVIPLYDGKIAQPEEGELYRRSLSRRKDSESKHVVWRINIDKKCLLKARGFQVLWDA